MIPLQHVGLIPGMAMSVSPQCYCSLLDMTTTFPWKSFQTALSIQIDGNRRKHLEHLLSNFPHFRHFRRQQSSRIPLADAFLAVLAVVVDAVVVCVVEFPIQPMVLIGTNPYFQRRSEPPRLTPMEMRPSPPRKTFPQW